MVEVNIVVVDGVLAGTRGRDNTPILKHDAGARLVDGCSVTVAVTVESASEDAAAHLLDGIPKSSSDTSETHPHELHLRILSWVEEILINCCSECGGEGG